MNSLFPPALRTQTLRVVVLGVLAAAGWWSWRSSTAIPARSRTLSLIVSGDTSGWIVPCGCTSNQSGGLLRRGTYVRSLGGEATVLLADAGGAPGGASAYDRVKFEAILKGEALMGLAAHNLGGPEVALGAEFLRDVARRTNISFVSANVRDARSALIAPPVRVVEVGQHRVALAGVVSPQYTRTGLKIDDPRSALLSALSTLKEKYDWLVVLAYLPEDELQQFAAQVPEIDAVIGGPTGQAIAPRAVGPVTLAAATKKGKFLVRLDFAGGGQRAITGQVVEMDSRFSDDPQQSANVQSYLAELKRLDLPVQQTSFFHPLPEQVAEIYRIAGSDACISCHDADCELWRGSKHAHAWTSLTKRAFEVDAYCQQCHTTGFGLPGGFASVGRSVDRTSVGCESCHGPSWEHTRKPGIKPPFDPHDRCSTCHDIENSPAFEYVKYWPRIRHGTGAIDGVEAGLNGGAAQTKER